MPKNDDLKLLIDVGVGRQVEKWLLENGYDTKSIRDIDPRMTDREILRLAATEERLIITMDKDFGELVYNSKLSHAGVLLLRLESATADEKVVVMSEIMGKYSEKLIGSFSVLKDGKLRIRK